MEKEESTMQGWERQMDGTMRAVRHFDMEKEIMDFQRQAEKKRELRLQKQIELEKKRGREKARAEREISK